MTAPHPQAESFESFWSLDPAVTYLNHGSFGACPTQVLQYQSELRAKMETNPQQFLLRESGGLIDASRQRLAELVGADPANLVFSQNITAAVSTVLRSFELSPGDEILTTDHGYSACTTGANYVAKKAGAVVTTATIGLPIESEDQIVEAIMQAVTERTRLAIVDHVTSATAVIFPIQRIVDALRSRGVAVLVDGAHAPGMIPLDLETIDADWYTGHCHKWLCAPKGASFLYASPRRQASLDPLIMSHGMHTRREGRSRFHDAFDWTGTFDPTAWCSVGKAIDTLSGLLPGGLPALQARNHQLIVEAREQLLAALPIRPVCPASMLGSMAAFMPPDDPAAEPRFADVLSATPVHLNEIRLADQGVVMPWSYYPTFPQQMFRISAHAYNKPDDYQITGLIEKLIH